MTTEPDQKPDTTETSSNFEESAHEDSMGLVQEFVLFLKENKAWWMVPILLALALIGVAVWLGGSAVAPFIYPLF